MRYGSATTKERTLFYMARRRFFVDEVRAGRAHIFGGAAYHLARVLRIEPGQKFEISDNRDVFLAEVDTVGKDLVSFSILDRLAPLQPVMRITLVASLIRFERFEWLLEKATELGIEKIVPAQAERSEKGLDLAAQKRVLRWRKIVREASEQSRRVRLPEVHAAMALSKVLTVDADFRYVLDEAAGATPIASAMPATRNADDRVAVLVGPEGGWTDRERAAIVEQRWLPVGIGTTILRTETAAIAGLAVIIAFWQNKGA